MNLPNAITLLRLLLVPCVPVLFYNGMPYGALAVYLFASFTDMIDGYLARKLDQVTKFGKVADPLADKLMLITVLACLFAWNCIPLWITVIMLLKEILMITVGGVLYLTGTVIPANMFGKVATFLFAPAVVLAFFAAYVHPWHLVFLSAATLVAYIAMVQYGLIMIKEKRGRRAV